ncbi:hypothetical protein EV356DRAFT_574403 [Viridothelium virens]|uniref:Fork-head domain-containing protein n=1 Tax=Viridothelium virens TaxID=1048519 RepID=A0A6A6HGJ2_VIRVR|nr:hypothetical protein EV356DRAFT_574403 [Viridothelium virens]
MNGNPSQQLFMQKDPFEIEPNPDPWLTNVFNPETALYNPEGSNLYSLQPSSHESVNCSPHAYGHGVFQNSDSYHQMASTQTLPNEFEISRMRRGTPSSSNYLLEYGPDKDSMSRPRTLPNVNFPRASTKGLYTPEDAFPPSCYELDSPQPPQLSSLNATQSPKAAQVLKEGASQPDELAVASFSGGPFSTMPPQSQYSSNNFDTQSTMLVEPDEDFVASREPTPDSEMKEEPYAKKIHRCLISAPGHTMVLRDIYEWFIQNTEKCKEPDASAWKNSIRHNLSMNAAFVKVNQPQGEEQKKGCSWKLADFAVKEGVKSTTRYRTKAPSKRSARTRDPDQKRMEAGAKGGQASKKAAQRRSQRLRDNSQLSPTTIPHLTSSGPPPVGDVPLLGSENRAERQTSPYFVTHMGPVSYSQQQYTPTIPTSAPQQNPTRQTNSSHFSPITMGYFSHIPGMSFTGQPIPSPDEPFFYDSPAESGDEPITPSSMGVGRMPDPFWGTEGTADSAGDLEMQYGTINSMFPA